MGQILEKKLFEVTIADHQFRLRSSQNESFVHELVKIVDHRIKQALNATKSGSVQNAAVLAALNIAEELVLLKKRALREIAAIEEKALRLSQELEKNSQTNPKNQKGVAAASVDL